jgi:hypothetical protein
MCISNCELRQCDDFVNGQCTNDADMVHRLTGAAICKFHEDAIPRVEWLEIQDSVLIPEIGAATTTKCAQCKMMDIPVYRSNLTGQPAIWKCEPCMIAEGLMKIVNEIKPLAEILHHGGDKQLGGPCPTVVVPEAEDKLEMLVRRSWEDFRNAGLLWWVNTILHMFGWALTVVMDEGKVVDAYPARTKFRGFSEKNNTEGYQKVSSYLQKEIDALVRESYE